MVIEWFNKHVNSPFIHAFIQLLFLEFLIIGSYIIRHFDVVYHLTVQAVSR